MPTRRQNPDTHTFRQAAFASSVEHERGILGNLVAGRCQKVSDPEEIAILWWLQQISWREGGLEKFAEDFLEKNEWRVGTASMHRFGFAPGQLYDAAQVRVVRGEIEEEPEALWEFLCRGETKQALVDPLNMSAAEIYTSREEADAFPSHHPAESFLRKCGLAPERLAETLKRALVDPASPSLRKGLWNLPTLWDALVEWRDLEAAEVDSKLVETEVTRQIAEELDFALESRDFVVIEGREGIGKSEGARAWCRRHVGRAIYVQLESGVDETTLFRSIARRIGTACSYQRKCVEMRARIQDALQPGHLMLVLDEAHFLWPQSGRSERAAPKRLDWLRTALVDFGVPVALISTPQYFANACDRFLKGGWNAGQILRRVMRTARLPDTLCPADAIKLAGAYFPGMPDALLKRVAGTAILSAGHLTTFSHLRKRVDFWARRRPGAAERELLEAALEEINPALARPAPAPGKGVAHAPQPAGRDRATSVSGSALVPANRTASPQLRPDPIMT